MKIKQRPVNLGVSRYVNAKMEVISAFMNLLSLNRGEVGPPAFDYKILSTGDFTFADDLVSQVKVV